MKILLFTIAVAVIQTAFSQDLENPGKTAKDRETDFPKVPLPPQRLSEFDISLYHKFDSLEELKEWAYNTSPFGGWAKTIEISGREVHYSVRTFRSGVANYELIFFSKNHRNKITPFLAIPVRGQELEVTVKGTQVIVEAFIDSKLTPILSFSDLMLPVLHKKGEAQQGDDAN